MCKGCETKLTVYGPYPRRLDVFYKIMVVRAEIRFTAKNVVMLLSRDIYSDRPKIIS